MKKTPTIRCSQTATRMSRSMSRSRRTPNGNDHSRAGRAPVSICISIVNNCLSNQWWKAPQSTGISRYPSRWSGPRRTRSCSSSSSPRPESTSTTLMHRLWHLETSKPSSRPCRSKTATGASWATPRSTSLVDPKMQIRWNSSSELAEPKLTLALSHPRSQEQIGFSWRSCHKNSIHTGTIQTPRHRTTWACPWRHLASPASATALLLLPWMSIPTTAKWPSARSSCPQSSQTLCSKGSSADKTWARSNPMTKIHLQNSLHHRSWDSRTCKSHTTLIRPHNHQNRGNPEVGHRKRSMEELSLPRWLMTPTIWTSSGAPMKRIRSGYGNWTGKSSTKATMQFSCRPRMSITLHQLGLQYRRQWTGQTLSHSWLWT